MKPIYLEFCGINSFSEKTEIDFSALLSGGVFGIFGDTGSGKSTILDCIHLALYGVVERASKSMADCINYNMDSAYVLFEFEIMTDGKRRRFRVRRERKRKKSSPKAYLYECAEDGKYFALAEGTRDVDAAIEEIIGLTFNDFKMCIALPQGDFAALVKATTRDRGKLVSRLFDLEKYGEKLSKAANEKYYKAESDMQLLKAQMGQNEWGDEESISAKEAEIEQNRADLIALKEELKRAEEKTQRLARLFEEKQAYEKVCAEIEKLIIRLPEMEQKKKDVERLSKAKLVKERADELKKNANACMESKRRLQKAEEDLAFDKEKVSKVQERLQAENFEEKILALTVQRDTLQSVALDQAALDEVEKQLGISREEYSQTKKKCIGEDFDGIRKALEEEYASLDASDSLLGYLKNNYKGVFLAEEYAKVRADLRGLAEKYPQAQEDVALLIEKYSCATPLDEQFDVAKINLEFKAVEQKKKELGKRIADTDKRELDYNNYSQQLTNIQSRGVQLNAEKAVLLKKLERVKDMGSLEETQRALTETKAKQTAWLKELEEAQARLQTLAGETEKQKGLLDAYQKQDSELKIKLQNAVENAGFEDVDEALDLVAKLGDEVAIKAECDQFFEKYRFYLQKQKETDASVFAGLHEEILLDARREKSDLERSRDALTSRIAAEENELKRLYELREKYRAFEKELVKKESEFKLCDELRTLLKSTKFLEFVSAEYLQEICITASKTLLSLTSGRYFLKYKEEDFKVGDNLDGGNLRTVKTLSGGETFLVSLSLALSLSAAICQKSLRPIEFFFLDEGFGTLDGKLVDTVMDVLGKLSKDFAVGLISHVEELKHRIDNKLLVTGANESHGSKVKMELF